MLSILCILTFIGSGFGVLGFGLTAINYESNMEALRVVYGNMPEASFLLNAPRSFFTISFLLSSASVLGAYLMWRLRKPGFHLYTSAQIIYLVLPMIYFPGQTNPLLNIFLTAIFVYLYARNLRFMK